MHCGVSASDDKRKGGGGGRQEQRFDNVHILVDAGPHFVCGRFIGWAMRNLRCSVPGLEEVALSPAPPGHGKGPCDGEFGVLRSLRKELERTHWINDLPTCLARLQEEVDYLYDDAPLVPPHRHVVNFDPPSKRHLPRCRA